MSMLISNTTQFGAPQVQAEVALAVPALPGTDVAAAFADWMGLDVAAAPADAAGDPAAEADADDEAAPAPEALGADAQAAAEQQDLGALQAMMVSMPLPMPVQAPVAVAQALPGAAAEAAPADAAAPAPITLGAVGQAPVAQQAAAAPAPEAQPQPPAQAAQAPAAPAPQPAASVQPAPAFAAALGQAAAAAANDAPAAADAPMSATGAGAAAPAAAPLAATTELKLAAATPAAWQQPLREALGDRLQLQLSRNIDQAVIRLDPPNLGRVEIAIRHMAGTLEVNISATHSEVVRQLHTISDTMRSDLAQRQPGQFGQFTEVAVNVTTAARGAAGQQQAFDQQGRQRQQDRAAEDNDPGRALAEAGHPSSTFSLNAREYA